jgi:hypothetical protein
MSKVCRPARGTIEVLNFLKEFIAKHDGIGPSPAVIQREFRWKSRTSAVQILARLERESLLKRAKGSKLLYELVVHMPHFADTEEFASAVRVPFVFAEEGKPLPTPEEDDERFDSYWIDKRLFGVSRRRTPFVVQFASDLAGAFSLRRDQALLILPWREKEGTCRCWVLATIDGKIGIFWAYRKEFYTYLKRIPR